MRSYANYQFDPPMSLDPLVDLPRPPAERVARRGPRRGRGVRGQRPSQREEGDAASSSDCSTEPGRRRSARGHQGGRGHAARGRRAEADRDPRRRDSKRESERAAAVKALRVLNDKRAVEPIQTLLAGKNPATLKVEALRTLAALDAAGRADRGREAARPARPDAARRGGRGPGRDQARGEAHRRAVRRQEAAARLLPAGHRGAQEVRRRPGHRQAPGGGAARRAAPLARTGPDREGPQAGGREGRPEEGPRTVPEHEAARLRDVPPDGGRRRVGRPGPDPRLGHA